MLKHRMESVTTRKRPSETFKVFRPNLSANGTRKRKPVSMETRKKIDKWLEMKS